MKVILLGSGGREAALAWKMSASPLVSEVCVVPGNPGMKQLSNKISVKKISWEEIVQLKPDLVVIGPEQPLSEGVVDYLQQHQIKIVGPTKAAALLESSKIFCKEILRKARVPTAKSSVARSLNEGLEALRTWPFKSVVLKVDELAQGKGVVVCHNITEAEKILRAFFDGSYLGVPAKALLLEEVLLGEECSAFALCDGENFVFLGSAVDHKRLLDKDLGPNTGGMGAISPAPFLSLEDEAWIARHIFAPTLQTMKAEGNPFAGFLFAGLMKTERGFQVLEFNVRLGDPETQALLPRLEEDLVPWLMRAASSTLPAEANLKASAKVACHVVMAAQGYPGINGTIIRKGDKIQQGQLEKNCFLFTAGVNVDTSGVLLTSGGRVCGLTALGNSLPEARQQAYRNLSQISFSGMQFRSDIGAKYL